MEQSFFNNEKHLENNESVVSESERVNIEALKEQRETYALKAIAEVKKQFSSPLTSENEGPIYVAVMDALAREHHIDPEILITGMVHSEDPNEKRAVEAVEEFYSTYPEDYIKDLIQKEF
jgi:hypothetical protein